MYFKSPEGQHKLLANTSQVGVPSIAQPVTYLRTIEIPLPPLPEQRAIAHVLGTLDDKIELNRRMNETLEAMARAIFQDWFVELRAPSAPSWRAGNPTCPRAMVPLPRPPGGLRARGDTGGWGVKALGEFVELNLGESMKKGTVAPYLDMAALPTSGPNPDDTVLRESLLERASATGTRCLRG